jgi:hypothetical protein
MREGVPLYREAPWAVEAFLAAGGQRPEEAAAELDKFFVLTRVVSSPVAVISRNIDLLWHKLIEHTELYPQLCLRRYGLFIHHRPRSDHTPVPASAIRTFYGAYAACHGTVGAAWEQDAPMAIVRYGRGLTDQLDDEVRWSGWPGREKDEVA